MSGANLTAVSFTAQTAQTWSISGTISPAASGSGTTVTLSGAKSASTTADASGNYSFSGLANGSYTVTPTKAGLTFTPASLPATVSGANLTAVNFTVQTSQTWSISGTISPAASGSGTTVTLSGSKSATTTADSSGNYTFGGLANGNYTVTPTKAGLTFTPASLAETVNGANLTAVNFTVQGSGSGSIGRDVTQSRDNSTRVATIVSPSFSTASTNELLLAFISADYVSGPKTTVKSLSGAGLTWTLVVRTNAQAGDSEIWRAFAPARLSNVSVTATLSQSTVASMTVMGFTGVSASGTNGSGAIGAITSGHAQSGGPTATLTTTRSNSWVFGVGVDFDAAIARTPGAVQTLIHQYLPSNSAGTDSFWVQMQNAPTPVSGTRVTINDTAPTSDEYNLSVVEILPPAAPTGQAQGAMLTMAVPSGQASQSIGMSQSLTMSNAASGAQGDSCSPGGLATLAGAGFTTQSPQSASSFPLPTRLAGVQVKVNGTPAPLVMASNAQVNFQCPDLPAGAQLAITLEPENATATYSIQSVMKAAQPGLFGIEDDRQGLVTIGSTNEIAMETASNRPSRPARPGETLTIFASGLGEAINGVPAGAAAPMDRLILLRNKIKVEVAGVEVDPTWAGLAPGTAGLFQVSLQLPADTPAGTAIPISVEAILPDGTVVPSNNVTVTIGD